MCAVVSWPPADRGVQPLPESASKTQAARPAAAGAIPCGHRWSRGRGEDREQHPARRRDRARRGGRRSRHACGFLSYLTAASTVGLKGQAPQPRGVRAATGNGSASRDARARPLALSCGSVERHAACPRGAGGLGLPTRSRGARRRVHAREQHRRQHRPDARRRGTPTRGEPTATRTPPERQADRRQQRPDPFQRSHHPPLSCGREPLHRADTSGAHCTPLPTPPDDRRRARHCQRGRQR